MTRKREWMLYSAAGLFIGATAVLLWKLGNPPNMGLCAACFERDIAGAFGLHGADKLQYLRPEILGIVLGALLLALARGEFKAKAGSAPVSMFVMGAFAMIGALAFLGCPVRMWLRLSAGDLNAGVGLLGLFAGVGAGSLLIKFRWDAPPARDQKGLEGWLFPALAAFAVALIALKVSGAAPALLRSSEHGPGSMRPGGPASVVPPIAGIAISLAAGVAIGAVCRLAKVCTTGAIRDLFLARNAMRFSTVLALAAAWLAGSLVFGSFKAGFDAQPIAHSDHVWNFLGLALVGLAGTLMGGCPLRQLVRAGGGDSDAAVASFGFIAGAAISHNFGLAGSAAGVPPAGRVAVIAGLAVVALIGAAMGKGKAAS